MAVNEQIVTGRKFRKLVDEATKLWQRISFWTKASDVEFNDGSTAETKMGAINGITDSLASTSSNVAASAKALNQLNNKLTSQLPGDVKLITEGSGVNTKYYIQLGADAASKKSLGSSMYKCPDISRLHIDSLNIGANRVHTILTFGRDIKLSSDATQFDFNNAYWVFMGTNYISNVMFETSSNIGKVPNAFRLSRNSDGIIVNSGKYAAIFMVLGVGGDTTIKNVNIEWV